MLLVGRVLDVEPLWTDRDDLQVVQLGVEVFFLLARVVDLVPLDLDRIEGLATRHRLVLIA